MAHWTRLSEDPYLLPEPKPASTLSTPQEPRSPVRPELSDGEGDNEDLEDEAEGADLDMGEIDWGEAMAEMDDLLNETDDDTTDRDEDGENSSTKGKSSKKRGRISSAANTDDESDGGGGPKKKNGASTESPLQKRVKTARSRSSGLKTSLSASALAAAAASDSESGSVPPIPSTSIKDPQDLVDSAIGRAESAEMSQASSSISSDDEGFLASLEAELEAGFEEGEGEGGDEDDEE